eukprot:gene44693-54656_t
MPVQLTSKVLLPKLARLRTSSLSNLLTQVRFGSSDSKKPEKIVPESFYDEGREAEREFLDFASVLTKDGGLHKLAAIKNAVTWEDMQKACAQPSKVTKHSMVSQVVPQHSNISTEEVEGGDDSEQLTPGEEAYLSSALHSELAEHLDQFDELPVMLPPSMLNYNMPWRKSLDSSEPEADNFIRDSDPQKQRFDKQGNRSCPGKLQRKGKAGSLQCIKIDLDRLHHFDVLALRHFLSADAEIMPRRLTGLCAKCQRSVAKTIKRARHFGILPHLGHYEIQNAFASPLNGVASSSSEALAGESEQQIVVSKVVFS